MKKLSVLFLGAVLAAGTFQTIKADTIADWTFQTSASTNNIIGTGKTPSATQSGILADIGTGSASASHAASTTVWSIPSGNGSSNSWSSTAWAVGDYFQFSLATSGFTNITLSYDQTGSSTGPGKFALAYSLNGSSFTVFGVTNTLTVSSWNPSTVNSSFTFSYDLSSVTSLSDDASSVYFRVIDETTTSINGGTTASGGTDRIDNFLVSGTSLIAVPEPTTLALAALGGVFLVALRRRR